MESTRDAAVSDAPARPTSVGLWGPSGMGKTQFAASIIEDAGFSPALYIDVDGGTPAIVGHVEADRIVSSADLKLPARSLSDVIAIVRKVQEGKITNRAGEKVRSVIVDAVTVLLSNEIGARGLQSKEPRDQATPLIQPFKVFFGQLRALPTDYGVTLVEVAHSKVKSVKVMDTVHELHVPDLFNSIARPWMQHLRHVWRVTKTRGARGPAFPAMQLRTEAEGVFQTPRYVEYMKTSNIAFAQWLAEHSAPHEHYQWDTGTLPPDQHPTLAHFLRVAEDLALEQGRVCATTPAALRALSSLQAASAAAEQPTEA